MFPFKINHIDHVALRVHNLKKSIQWYISRLDFKELHTPEWNRYPVLLQKEDFFLALFQEKASDKNAEQTDLICIDHFAFNVSLVDYELAKKYYQNIDEPYREADHIYSKSIYLHDPDGHVVELTVVIKELA